MNSFASSRAPAEHDGFIHVRGANENNLDNVEVRIPRDAIVAFTGVSGSGKSSLAFGTIFAESQRRFLESVAPYARRLIAQGHTPRWNSSPDFHRPWPCSNGVAPPVRGPRSEP